MARVHMRMDIPRGTAWKLHDVLVDLSGLYPLNFRPDPKAANVPGGLLPFELVFSDVEPAECDGVEARVRAACADLFGDTPVVRVE